jgi:hypothetical protein
MTGQPGFTSISLHCGLDGKHIVTYVSAPVVKQLVAPIIRPDSRKLAEVGKVSEEIEWSLYEVAHAEDYRLDRVRSPPPTSVGSCRSPA